MGTYGVLVYYMQRPILIQGSSVILKVDPAQPALKSKQQTSFKGRPRSTIGQQLLLANLHDVDGVGVYKVHASAQLIDRAQEP